MSRPDPDDPESYYDFDEDRDYLEEEWEANGEA